MLKHTDSRSIKLYLYSCVILPIKKLNVEFSRVETPFFDKETGAKWFVELIREPLTENVRHHFQRDRQERERNWLVTISKENYYERFPIAYYNQKTHEVRLYEVAFKKLGMAHVLGHFYEAFDTHTPFTKITIDSSAQEYQRVARRTGVNLSRLPF